MIVVTETAELEAELLVAVLPEAVDCTGGVPEIVKTLSDEAEGPVGKVEGLPEIVRPLSDEADGPVGKFGVLELDAALPAVCESNVPSVVGTLSSEDSEGTLASD